MKCSQNWRLNDFWYCMITTFVLPNILSNRCFFIYVIFRRNFANFINNVNKAILMPNNTYNVLQIILNHASDPRWWIVCFMQTESVSHRQIKEFVWTGQPVWCCPLHRDVCPGMRCDYDLITVSKVFFMDLHVYINFSGCIGNTDKLHRGIYFHNLSCFVNNYL